MNNKVKALAISAVLLTMVPSVAMAAPIKLANTANIATIATKTQILAVSRTFKVKSMVQKVAKGTTYYRRVFIVNFDSQIYTLASKNVALKDNTGKLLPARLVLDKTKRVLTVTPKVNFSYGKYYTLTVLGLKDSTRKKSLVTYKYNIYYNQSVAPKPSNGGSNSSPVVKPGDTQSSTGSFGGKEVVKYADGREIEYYEDCGKIYYNVPKTIRTSTPAGNGAVNLKYDMNIIVGSDKNTKVGSLGGTLTVTNIVREGGYQNHRVAYATGPVTLTFSGKDFRDRQVGYWGSNRVKINNGKAMYVEADSSGKHILDGMTSNDQTITLSDQGYYTVYFSGYGAGISLDIYIAKPGEDISYRTPVAKTAQPKTFQATVNGTSFSLPAYNIDGENYVRMTDLAMMMKDTNKKFRVSTFKEDKDGINIDTRIRPVYNVTGGEFKAISSNTVTAKPTASIFSKEGNEINPSAYDINNETFVKLKDLAFILNTSYVADNSANTITLNTSVPYTD